MNTINPLNTPHNPIPVEGELRGNLEQQARMFALLSQSFDEYAQHFAAYNVYPVHDQQGMKVPGVICLDTGKEGKNAAVISMTHTNEPCGLSAQYQLLEDWLSGHRPESGKIYLAIGGNIEQGKAFFNRILDRTRYITNADISQYRSIQEINFNRIPERLLATSSPKNHDEKRVLQLREIFSKCNGNVLDLHSLSTPAAPIAITAVSKYDEKSPKSELSKILSHLPVTNVLVDITARMNGFMLSRIGGYKNGNIPIVMEAGGPHIAPHVATKAMECAQTWLENTIGFAKHKQYYDQTIAYCHPKMEPFHTPDAARELEASINDASRIEAIKNDTFILIQNPETLQEKKYWKTEASLNAIAQIKSKEGHTIKPGRLLNFSYIEKDDVLMVGQSTGHTVRARESGFLLMGPANPLVTPDQKECYIFSAKNPQKERILNKARTSSHLLEKILNHPSPPQPQIRVI